MASVQTVDESNGYLTICDTGPDEFKRYPIITIKSDDNRDSSITVNLRASEAAVFFTAAAQMCREIQRQWDERKK